MKKLFSVVVCLAVSLLTGFSHAGNIYLPGTEAHKLSNEVQRWLSHDVVPVIILESDRNVFSGSVDHRSVIRHGFTTERFAELQSEPWKQITLASNAYASVVDAVHGINPHVCHIRFINRAALKTALMHEAMHCRTMYMPEWEEFDRAARPLFAKSRLTGSDGNEVSKLIREAVLIEAHARILAYVLMKETRTLGDFNFIETRLNSDFPFNPGRRVVLTGLNFCRKQKCSSDPSELMSQLANNSEFSENYLNDVLVAHTVSTTKGYYASE